MVAYKLELPPSAKIHPIFHVSQLKRHVGPMVVHTPLPMLTEDGLLIKEPVVIIDRRIGKHNGKAVTEVLIQWKNSFPEDATWESLPQMQLKYPDFHP